MQANYESKTEMAKHGTKFVGIFIAAKMDKFVGEILNIIFKYDRNHNSYANYQRIFFLFILYPSQYNRIRLQ